MTACTGLIVQLSEVQGAPAVVLIVIRCTHLTYQPLVFGGLHMILLKMLYRPPDKADQGQCEDDTTLRAAGASDPDWEALRQYLPRCLEAWLLPRGQHGWSLGSILEKVKRLSFLVNPFDASKSVTA